MEVAWKMDRCAGAPTPMAPGIGKNPKYARNSNCVRILDFWSSRVSGSNTGFLEWDELHRPGILNNARNELKIGVLRLF